MNVFTLQEFLELDEKVQNLVNGAENNITLDESGSLQVAGVDSKNIDAWLENSFLKYVKGKYPKASKDLVKSCLLELAIKNSDGKFTKNLYKTVFEYQNGSIGTWESYNTTIDLFIDDFLLREKAKSIKKFVEIYQKTGDAKGYQEIKFGIRKFNKRLNK